VARLQSSPSAATFLRLARDGALPARALSPARATTMNGPHRHDIPPSAPAHASPASLLCCGLGRLLAIAAACAVVLWLTVFWALA